MQKLSFWVLAIAFSQLCFASENIDLSKTKISCGNYILTNTSTLDDVELYCESQSSDLDQHLIGLRYNDLKIETDQFTLIRCEFKNNRLLKCQIKQK